MDKKKLTIILIILILAMAGLFIWFYFFRSTSAPTPGPSVATTTPLTTTITPDDQTITDRLGEQVTGKTQAEIDDRSAILGQARFFAERFGSFSSAAEWQNLKDLRGAVTAGLWSDFENLMARTDLQAEGSYSLTTKALNLSMTDQTETAATVTVDTQKREVTGEGERIFYQTVTVDVRNIDGQWLVSDYRLGPEKK